MATMVTTGVQAATGAGTSTATIVTPITITPVLPLAFGKIDAKTGGTVTMSVAGARTSSGVPVLMTTGNTSNQATFTIGGEANATYAITLPADGVVTLTDGVKAPMAVDTFASNPATTGTLDGTGAQTVNVGAVLTVGNAQAAGSYSGSFNVIVEYN